MPTNKFPLVYSTVEQEQIDSFGTTNPLNMGKSLVGAGAMAAPIFAAGIYSAKRISSNDYKQIAGLKSNAIGPATQTVGNNLRRVQEIQNKLRIKNQEKFRKSFLDGNFLDKITKESEAVQRRMLTGVIDALNESGLETAQIGPLKNRIIEILQAEQFKIEDTQKQVLKDTFGMLKDSNPDFFERINRGINYYAPVEEFLSSPLTFTNNKLNSSFTTIDLDSFGGKVKNRFREVQEALRDSNFSIDAVRIEERIGKVNANAAYARIIDKNTGRLNLIALDISDVTASIGAPLLRVGHGQQAFVAPVAIGKADVIEKDFLSKGSTFGAKDIEQSLKSNKKIKAFESIEDFQIGLLKKMIDEKGGRFHSNDFKDFNADIRGITQSLDRTFFDDEFGKMSRERIKNKGSVIGFHLDGLDPKQLRDFSANIIASQADMGLLTGHTNLQIASMENFRMVNLTMTHGMKINLDNSFGSTLGKLGEGPTRAKRFDWKASGLEADFRLGGIAMTDVVHSVLPLTARPKQFFDNDAVFVNKTAAGYTLADKTTDRTLMLLDMKSGRLGLTEGESYLSTGKRTRKIFPKTVMDPKTMGTSSNLLLNELIRRSNENLGNLIIEKGSIFQLGKEKIGIGVIGKDIKTYDTIGDFFRAQGTKEAGGLFLGKLDGNLIEVPFYRGIERLELGIVERTTGTGADLFRIVGSADLKDDVPKIFSEHVKATVQPLERKTDFEQLFDRYKGISFGELDIGHTINTQGKVRGKSNKELISTTIGAAPGSMLKKARYYHALQIAGGAEALAAARGMDGQKVAETILQRAEDIRNTVEVIDPKTKALVSKVQSGSFAKIKNVKTQQHKYMSSFVQSVTEFMGGKEFQKSGATTAAEVGRVFGGFMEAFEKDGSTFSSMSRSEIMGFIESNISKDKTFLSSVDEEIRKGLAISLSNLRAGPDIATYRANQASMEARLFNFLAMKMTQVGGLSANETSDFLFSLMSRKSDAGNELIALKEHLKFHEYAKSQESFFDAKIYQEMDRVSLKEFTDMDPEQLDNFLKQRKGGFLLDFGTGTSASDALNKVFKGKGSLYIPAGVEFMEAIKSQGTEIIKKEGTIVLPSEYRAQLGYFSENLSGFMNSSNISMDQTRKAEVHIRNFQNKMAEISSNVFRNIMKGKLTGSASLRSAGIKLSGSGKSEKQRREAIYGKDLADDIIKNNKKMVTDDIGSRANLTDAERNRMKKMGDIVMDKRRGQSVFIETQGFLAAMNDFMEGAKKEYLLDDAAPVKYEQKMQYALGRARNDAAMKFQDFFLGGYEKYAASEYSDSLTGIITRHPLLSSGHVQTSSLVRYSPETIGIDSFLKNLLFKQAPRDENLQEIIRNVKDQFGENIFNKANFEALSNAAAQGMNNKQKSALTGSKGLFTYMVENISKFQEGEGAGRMFFPDMEIDVHYGQDKVRRINLSLASAAIGDMDGDLFQLILPSQRASKTINEKLTGKAAREAFADEMLYRGSLRMLFDEAGEGIEELSKSLGGSEVDPQKFLKDVGMKEILHKQVGQIDVALDSLRMGMINMAFTKEELRSVQSGLALLTVLEEVGTIKAKKLPKAFDFGKIITEAANYAYDTGDVSKLRNITENLVFKNRNISEGFNIKGLDMSGIASSKMRGAVEEAFKRSNNVLFDLESVFQVIARGAAFGKETGTRFTKTARGTARVLSNEKESRALLGGYMGAAQKSLTAQMVGESRDSIAKQTTGIINDAFDSIRKAGSIMDKKMLGPAIAGIAGALGLVGLLGSSGSSPQPLLMPGEVTDQALGQAIADGRLFDSRGSSTEPSDYYPGDPIHERPINIGQTYVKRDNSYIINGELPNTGAIAKVQNIINSIGGHSNFAINDTRGPITMNFINRNMDQ